MESITHCEKIGRKFELGKSLYEYSIFLNATGRKTDSIEQAEKAHKLFTDIGALGYVKKSADLLEQPGQQKPKEAAPTTSLVKIREAEGLKTILDVGKSINSILDLDRLLNEIVAQIVRISGAQNGYLFYRESSSNKLKLKASIFESEKYYSKNVVRMVFESGKPVITTNTEAETGISQFQSVAEHEIKSIACLPLLRHGQVSGVLYLDNKLSSKVFKEDDIGLIEGILAQASLAIENASAYADIEWERNCYREFISTPQIINISVNRQKPKLGGHATEKTILFLDIRDFTSISEKLGAEDTVDLVNSLHALTGEIIHGHRGWIDKYIGDAVMVQFDSCADALDCSLEIFSALETYNDGRELKKYGDKLKIDRLSIGIGIAHGEVIEGLIGNRYKKDDTVMGHPVNLASRLEGYTKIYGSKILVCESVRAQIASIEEEKGYRVRQVDYALVKGAREQACGIFELYNADDKAVARLKGETSENFNEAISLYLAPGEPTDITSQWIRALNKFLEINDHFKKNLKTGGKNAGDVVSGILAARLTSMIQNPPAEFWKGIYVHSQK